MKIYSKQVKEMRGGRSLTRSTAEESADLKGFAPCRRPLRGRLPDICLPTECLHVLSCSLLALQYSDPLEGELACLFLSCYPPLLECVLTRCFLDVSKVFFVIRSGRGDYFGSLGERWLWAQQQGPVGARKRIFRV